MIEFFKVPIDGQKTRIFFCFAFPDTRIEIGTLHGLVDWFGGRQSGDIREQARHRRAQLRKLYVCGERVDMIAYTASAKARTNGKNAAKLTDEELAKALKVRSQTFLISRSFRAMPK